MFYALAKQLGNPRGWFGRAVMPSFLNQGNRTILDAAVRALGAKPGERIVDVGFGGGYALQLIAPMVKPLRVTGVEISEAMIDAASTVGATLSRFTGPMRWPCLFEMVGSMESCP